MKTQLMHAKETAQELNVSQGTLYKLAKTGQVPSIRVGKRYLFNIDEILKYLLAQPQQPAIAQRLPPKSAPRDDVSMAREALAKAADALAAAAKALEGKV